MKAFLSQNLMNIPLKFHVNMRDLHGNQWNMQQNDTWKPKEIQGFWLSKLTKITKPQTARGAEWPGHTRREGAQATHTRTHA